MTRLQTYILTLLCTVLALLGAGCGNSRVAEKLAQADRLMEEHPDSARLLLDGIDPSKLSRANTSLYAVLDAQSRHKLDLTAPSDSLLNIAVDHYTLHGPDSLLMKALFYRAVGKLQDDRVSEAVKDAMESWANSKSRNNYYWQAKTSELLADLFKLSLNFNQEAEWRSETAHLYSLASRQDNYLYALNDLASAYLNSHDSINCRIILDSLARAIPDGDSYLYLRQLAIHNEIYYNLNYGKLRVADSLLNECDTGYLPEIQHSLLLAKATVLMRHGDIERSRRLLDSISSLEEFSNDRALLFHAYYDLAKQSHNVMLMRESTDSLLELQVRDVERSISQPATIAQSEFYQAQAVREQRIHKRTKLVDLFIIISITSLLMIVVLIYRYTTRRKEKEIREQASHVLRMTNQLKEEDEKNREFTAKLERLNMDYLSLKQVLEHKDSEFKETQENVTMIMKQLEASKDELGIMATKLNSTLSRLPDFYKKRWEGLNLLCDNLLNREAVPPKILINELREELNKIDTDKLCSDLEEQLNRDFDNIMKLLREECPDLPANYYRICIMTFAGMPVPTIALLLRVTKRTFYVNRSRVITKLKEINPKHLSLFEVKFRIKEKL